MDYAVTVCQSASRPGWTGRKWKRNMEMKPSLLVAMSVVGVAASSPSFAKVRFHEYRYNGGQEVLVNKPSRPYVQSGPYHQDILPGGSLTGPIAPDANGG